MGRVFAKYVLSPWVRSQYHKRKMDFVILYIWLLLFQIAALKSFWPGVVAHANNLSTQEDVEFQPSLDLQDLVSKKKETSIIKNKQAKRLFLYRNLYIKTQNLTHTANSCVSMHLLFCLISQVPASTPLIRTPWKDGGRHSKALAWLTVHRQDHIWVLCLELRGTPACLKHVWWTR
jgi:hypothetical protein